jgi:hypothetical protein
MQSEPSTEVVYQLGKNPAKLLEIMQMTPINAIRELTTLEARLSAPPPPKTFTSAPAPAKPVGQSDKAPVSYETASMEDYVRLRRQERLKQKG